MATPTLERVLKERVASLVGADLALVEAEISREIASPVGLIREMGGYIAGKAAQRKSRMHLLPYGIPLCIGFVSYLIYIHGA